MRNSHSIQQSSKLLPPPKPPKFRPLKSSVKRVYAKVSEDTCQRDQLASGSWDFNKAVKALTKFKNDAQKKSEGELIDEFVTNETLLVTFDKVSKQQSVLSRLRAGYILNGLRKKSPHGTWEQLIRQRLPGLSRATINRYRDAAVAYPDPRDVPSSLTTTELYRRAKSLRNAEKSGKCEGKVAEPKGRDAREIEKAAAQLERLAIAFRARGTVSTLGATSKDRLAAKFRSLSAQLLAIADALEGKAPTTPLAVPAATSLVPTVAPFQPPATTPVNLSGNSTCANSETVARPPASPPPPLPPANSSDAVPPSDSPRVPTMGPPPPPPPPPFVAGVPEGNVSH